jgi:hypothetical protein
VKAQQIKFSVVLAVSAFISSSVHANAADANAIQSGPESIQIYGHIVAGAGLEAEIYYTPDLKANVRASDCFFPEDEYSPNGHDRYVPAKAIKDGHNYTLNLPTTAVNGACHYVLSAIYLDVKSSRVLEPLKIQTVPAIIEDGMREVDSVPFKDQKIYCQFDNPNVGICRINDDLPPQLYSIGLKPHKVRFDVLLDPTSY